MSTQLDRVLVVILAVVVLATVAYLIMSGDGDDAMKIFIPFAGTVVGAVVAALMRISSVNTSQNSQLAATLSNVEQNVNGNLTARLEKLRADIVNDLATSATSNDAAPQTDQAASSVS